MLQTITTCEKRQHRLLYTTGDRIRLNDLAHYKKQYFMFSIEAASHVGSNNSAMAPPFNRR